MTVTDRTAATEQEFRSRIAAFDAAPTPPEVLEAAVVEEVAFAIWGTTMRDEMTWEDWRRLRYEDDRRFYREQAAAAVAAYRATQDGGAEEAVRRVEAVATVWEGVANTWQETADHPNTGPEFRAHCLAERDDFRDRVTVLRAAIGESR